MMIIRHVWTTFQQLRAMFPSPQHHHMCIFMLLFSDSLQWPMISSLHAGLITHFLLSPISCTAAAHMAPSCCGCSYATVERGGLAQLSKSAFTQSNLWNCKQQGLLINSAQQAWCTDIYQVTSKQIEQANGDMKPSQRRAEGCSVFGLHIQIKLNLCWC